MAATKTFTATTAEQDIVAGSFTKRVRVAEDPSVAGWPTVDYLIKRPNASYPAIQRSLGTSYEILGNFHPGQVLGTIALVAGAAPTTFQQDEE